MPLPYYPFMSLKKKTKKNAWSQVTLNVDKLLNDCLGESEYFGLF